MFSQNILLAKSVLPTILASLRDTLEILRSLLCFLASPLHLISTSVVETIQTSAHDLWRFLAYLSLYHDFLLSRRTSLPLSFGYLPVVSISDILVPTPNHIWSHILYDLFSLVPSHQYTNSISAGEFIPDHRSGHSSQFQ